MKRALRPGHLDGADEGLIEEAFLIVASEPPWYEDFTKGRLYTLVQP